MKMTMSFRRREPLVPQVYRDRKRRPQGFRKSLGFCSLGAHVPRHVERIPNDNRRTPVFAQQASERLEILLCVFSNQSEHRLRGQAQFIRDGHADAAVAKIEAEQTLFHT